MPTDLRRLSMLVCSVERCVEISKGRTDGSLSVVGCPDQYH